MPKSPETLTIATTYGKHSVPIIHNKDGLAIHKGVVDVGSMGASKPVETDNYKVTHVPTGKGLTLGDGFDKLKTAKEYVNKLSELTDWQGTDIPHRAVEEAFKIHNSIKPVKSFI